MTTWQEDPYQGDPDLSTPWGIEAFVGGEIVHRLTRPSQFIRNCYKVVEEHQYRTIDCMFNPQGPVVLDAITANMMKQVWEGIALRTKKRLLKVMRERGPVVVINICWKAVSPKAA